MLHNCITSRIILPFLMNTLWKTPIAYSVRRQKVLTLVMNLGRRQSLFSSRTINSPSTDHFSPHLNSFHSHTTTSLFKSKMCWSTPLHVWKTSKRAEGRVYSLQKTRCNTHVTLPTMFPNNSMKTTVLPLGFNGENKPDQTKCDLTQCIISSHDENWTLLHGSFHSFHDVCLNGSTSCPLCREHLKQKVK